MSDTTMGGTVNGGTSGRAGRRLVAAAVVAGALALPLIWVGLTMQVGAGYGWDRFTDPGYWVGSVMQFLGALAFGKAGLKIGLLVAGGVAGAIVWARQNRRVDPPTGPAGSEAPSDGR